MYVDKLMQIQKPALQELLKCTEHENEKKQRAEKDRMTNHVMAYRRIQVYLYF